jgi:predicted RNase H-like HicB family nuclease
MKTQTQHVVCYLAGRVRQEGDWYVAECLGLPVVAQGETDAQAMASLIEATQLFVETCIERGTLEQVLIKHSWRPSPLPPRQMDPAIFSLPVPLPVVVKKHFDECQT